MSPILSASEVCVGIEKGEAMVESTGAAVVTKIYGSVKTASKENNGVRTSIDKRRGPYHKAKIKEIRCEARCLVRR